MRVRVTWFGWILLVAVFTAVWGSAALSIPWLTTQFGELNKKNPATGLIIVPIVLTPILCGLALWLAGERGSRVIARPDAEPPYGLS